MTDPPDPTPGDPHEEFLVLVVRYFDGDLGGGELAGLNARLRADPAARRAFAEYGARGCLIRETLAPERRPDPSPAREPSPPEPLSGRRPRRRRVLLLTGVAAAAAVALALALRPGPRPDDGPAVVGTVRPGAGEVRVTGPDGHIAAAGSELRSGDTVRTGPGDGSAAVGYPDGTELVLAGDTSVTCSAAGGKLVVLHHGALTASVTPQPAGSPLVVATPLARVEVRGTAFTCRIFPDRTDVVVTRGRVHVVRTTDGRGVDVTAGKRVAAAAGGDLAVEDASGPPDSWDLDFEQGLPPGLHRGRFVSAGLPRGSRGGVAAVPSANKDAEGFFEIASPEAWHRGLFAVRPDSHLHLTYKMERPGWVNVFVCARGPDPHGPHAGNYLFNEPEFHAGARPGRWRTVGIPLATLRRAGSTRDARPGPDEVPYLVLLSSQGDRGLVVDRVWVTRGGPGVVRYQDVE